MPAASKPAELRDTGISVLGRVPWSTHFSLFYETRADLLSVVVPFFKAGLEAGELCVWLPSDEEIGKEVHAALRAELPDFDQRLADRDLEFIEGTEFYRPTGTFDIDAVMERWQEKLDRARDERYAGLRGSGDLSWLGTADWRTFAEFEKRLHYKYLHGRQSIVLCTYPLSGRGAADLLDAARTHHFVLARRAGEWEAVETPSLKKTKEEIQRLNQILEDRVAERTRQLARSESYLNEGERLSHTGSFAADANSDFFTYVSPENRRIFDFPAEGPVRRSEVMARIHPEDRAKVLADVRTSIEEKIDTETEFRIVLPDGRIRYLFNTRHPVVDDGGRVVELLGTVIDYTERRLAATKLARARRAAREQAMEARFAAALEERTRLAREIHDSLLQGVTGIALQLRATLPRLKGASAATSKSISEVVELAESTIRDARRAVWDMRAPALVQKGLAKALAEVVERAAGDVPLEFKIVGKTRALRPEAEDTIFRVGQEAVINAARHGASRGIKVTLTYKARSATLTVVDDGRGFRVDQAVGAGRWGLLGMRERAERIGAKLTVRSKLGRGTTVELRTAN